MVQVFNPTTQEAEAGGLKVQGLPALQSKFKASLRQLTVILSPKLILRRAEKGGHGGSCVIPTLRRLAQENCRVFKD